MNKNTMIIVLLIVMTVLVISYMNRDKTEKMPKTMTEVKHDLDDMGDKIENKANEIKDDLKN